MERAGAASLRQGVKHDQFNPRRGFEPPAALPRLRAARGIFSLIRL